MMGRTCGVPSPAGTAEEEVDMGALTDATLYGHVSDGAARQRWVESQRDGSNSGGQMPTVSAHLLPPPQCRSFGTIKAIKSWIADVRRCVAQMAMSPAGEVAYAVAGLQDEAAEV